jgi:hypothetical protein
MPTRTAARKRGLMPTPGDTAATVIHPTGKPRRRRRSGRRTASATTGATQHLSVARRSGSNGTLAPLINEFIAVAQDMNVFKPGVNTQALANVWARIGVHSGLTL